MFLYHQTAVLSITKKPPPQPRSTALRTSRLGKSAKAQLLQFNKASHKKKGKPCHNSYRLPAVFERILFYYSFSVLKDEYVVKREFANLGIEQKIVNRRQTPARLPVCDHALADVKDLREFGLRYAVVHVKTTSVAGLSVALFPLCPKDKTHVAPEVQIVVSEQPQILARLAPVHKLSFYLFHFSPAKFLFLKLAYKRRFVNIAVQMRGEKLTVKACYNFALSNCFISQLYISQLSFSFAAEKKKSR